MKFWRGKTKEFEDEGGWEVLMEIWSAYFVE